MWSYITGRKYAVGMVGCLLAAALVISFVLPPLRERRTVLLFLVLALGLAPLSVTMGKAMSARHCPWDVAEFGGLVPYTPLFRPGAHDIEPGHCFPAGHASTGFALMAFYFAAHARRRNTAARAALLAGFGAGLVLGLGRVLQGAHFPSHVLWSGVLCWSVMVVLYVIVFRTPSGAAERTSAVVISGAPRPAPPV